MTTQTATRNSNANARTKPTLWTQAEMNYYWLIVTFIDAGYHVHFVEGYSHVVGLSLSNVNARKETSMELIVIVMQPLTGIISSAIVHVKR